MKFKYSAIGDNTQENREWLEKLGYKRGYHTYPSGNCIFTKDGFDYPYVTEAVLNDYPNAIDCRSNPQLFQAVTAISTTTDIGKHYINNHTGQWKRCDYNMATDENIDWNDWSEATLSELIAHFKVEH